MSALQRGRAAQCEGYNSQPLRSERRPRSTSLRVNRRTAIVTCHAESPRHINSERPELVRSAAARYSDGQPAFSEQHGSRRGGPLIHRVP